MEDLPSDCADIQVQNEVPGKLLPGTPDPTRETSLAGIVEVGVPAPCTRAAAMV